jgi:hypothetical protein
MAARTAIDIRHSLYERLRHLAGESDASIHSLIIRAIEQAYVHSGGGRYVTGALVDRPRKPGSAFPNEENPHDLVFS